jgi:hypothetical protein
MAERRSAKRHLRHLTARILITISSLLVITDTTSAQYMVSARAGVIQYIEGEVFGEGRLPLLLTDHYLQMENGQSLRTKQGRAELLLSPGAYLRLGENGLLRIEQNRLDDTRLTLVQGSALIEVVRWVKGNRIRISFLTTVIEVKKVGLYRLDAASGELRVYGGAVLVASRNNKTTIKMGRMVRLDRDLVPKKFDVDAADSLHEWAARRSFDLFVVSSNARTQMHWTPISSGWLRNSNYRMRFYSQLAYDELTGDQPLISGPFIIGQRHREVLENQPAAEAERRMAEEELRAEQARITAALEQAAAQAAASQAQIPNPEPGK